MATTMRFRHHLEIVVVGLALSLGGGAVAAEVVAVVSVKNPVSTLSKNQVADIFLGKTARFPDGEVALPIDQADGSMERDEFYAKFTGKSAAQVKAHWAKIIFTGRGHPPEDVPNNLDVKSFLNKNPHAIGYIDKSVVDPSLKVLVSE